MHAFIPLAEAAVRPAMRSRRYAMVGRRLAFLIATAAVLGLGSPRASAAATIASGRLWSEDAEAILCTLLNVGSTPVKVLSSRMIDGDGGNVLGFNNCFNKTLQPDRQCTFSVYTQQAAGIFKIDASKSHVRGICELQTKDQVVIGISEMH